MSYNENEAGFAELQNQQQLTGLVNRLFMYTDSRNWPGLINEVFTPNVYFDMESNSSGPPQTTTSQARTEMWHQGFQNVDSVHHQAG